MDHKNIDRIRINPRGRKFDFVFPKSTYMKNLITGIFEGRDYSLIPLPNYLPTTIVDVGANVGAAALYFYNAYPGAEIYCYEPSVINFQCLKENTKRFANIKVFPYGLFDRDCQMRLFQGINQTAQNSIMDSIETAENYETVTLVKASKEMITRNLKNLSILKIDTEGCEVPILSDCLSVVENIDAIYLEYHSEEDRLELDLMLSQEFSLLRSKVEVVHRGNCVYLSKKMIGRYPLIENLRIKRQNP